MLKKSLLVSVIFGFNSLFQLISQIVITRVFGATAKVDAFLLAVTLPTIIVTVIYGSFNDVFIPRFLEKKRVSEKESINYFIENLILMTIVMMVISLIFYFLRGTIITSLFPSKNPFVIKDATAYLGILALGFPLAIIATLAGGYWYANQKVVRFPVAQLCGAAVNLGIIFFTANFLGVWSLVYGFLANIIVHIIISMPKIKIIIPKIKLNNLKMIAIAWIPLILSSFLIRSDAIIIRSYGSLLPSGYLVYLNLIYKMFSLAAGITTIGLQTVFFPKIFETVSHGKYQETIYLIKKSKLAAVAISVFVALALYFLFPIIMQILFLGGKFKHLDISKTVALSPFFVIPAIGWGSYPLFFQWLVAFKKQNLLVAISLFSLISALVTGRVMIIYFDPIMAISISISVLLWIGIFLCQIFWAIERKKLVISPEMVIREEENTLDSRSI